MKQLVAGGIDIMIPPSKEEMKSWKSLYLCYFNSELSVKEGRRLPKYLCVKNPRPDEVIQALAHLGIKTVFE
jgi:signal recognition particle subunit SEC65